jgi:hypothetical protein
MTYREAKKKKIGDWVGYRKRGHEDGVIVNITHVTGKNELVFTVAFETHGIIQIKHKDLNPRTLMIIGKHDFSEALRCPSVMRLGLVKTTNDDLFKLWGIPNPLP